MQIGRRPRPGISTEFVEVMDPLCELSDLDLLERLRGGDEGAARTLFERYTARLTALARGRITRRLARRIDAEDVVHSAWRSFLVAGREGRWEAQPDGLWSLLAAMTLRKLSRQAARHTADRRDARRDESLDATDSDIAELSISRPSDELVVQIADELDEILDSRDLLDREIIFLRLSGQDSASIRDQLHCSERTARRVVEDVRRAISERIGEASDLRFGSMDVSSLLRTMAAHRPVDRRLLKDKELSARWADYPEVPFADVLVSTMVGQGGVGRVYRGTIRSSGRAVAVKFLKKRFWSSAVAVHSLFVELSAVAAVNHPGIIKHLGWGRTPSGVPYLVMEWFEGVPISEWVGRARPATGVIVRRMADAAAGLAAAHAAGVVHGDVSPGNILTSDEGRTVVTDFGFAMRSTDRQVQRQGGTIAFLAPEQLSTSAGPVGPWSDVYGFAMTLLALLGPEGSRSTTGISELDDVLRRCVELDPKQRTISMERLASQLRTISGVAPS